MGRGHPLLQMDLISLRFYTSVRNATAWIYGFHKQQPLRRRNPHPPKRCARNRCKYRRSSLNGRQPDKRITVQTHECVASAGWFGRGWHNSQAHKPDGTDAIHFHRARCSVLPTPSIVPGLCGSGAVETKRMTPYPLVSRARARRARQGKMGHRSGRSCSGHDPDFQFFPSLRNF
jgi:hypothetical protein